MENIKEQESLEAEVKEETKSVTTDDKKKSSGKKKTFIGIGVAAVAIIAVVLLLIVIISIVAVIAFHKPTVNMNDYITINASGYNGYGKASYDFDSEKFIEENGKKLKKLQMIILL